MSKSMFVKAWYLYILGLAAMIAFTMVSALLLPIFIINEYFPIEYTKVFIIILIGFSSFLGAFITGVGTKQRWVGAQLIVVGTY